MSEEVVVLGLSLSSSWGNGHATTYRALLRGLAQLGGRVLFLERDMPWYAAHRDLSAPDFCELSFYSSLSDLRQRFDLRLRNAGTVIVGSYVPEGIEVLDYVLGSARGQRCFYDIDTPVTLSGLERGDLEYLAPRQIRELDLYLSFSGGPSLSRLTACYGAQMPCALYCAVDETSYRPTGAAITWDLGYLGTYSADRQQALEKLFLEPARRLSNKRFVVAGALYPDSIRWPDNVERIDHLPPAAHANFYSAQRFTLNVTRAAMAAAGWSPSVRLFEAAACGTPVISDRWPGLDEVLRERESILIADNTEAVIAALTALSERTRQEIAARARAAVLREHTGIARARQLQRLMTTAPRRRQSADARAVAI